VTDNKFDPAKNNSAVFADYARYYDLLYQDKDYEAEADYVEELLKRFHPDAKTVLELGSGTGIHAHLLNKKGFTVHGIERSKEMLARSLILTEANRHDSILPQLSFSQGDIRTVQLHDEFDAVIALFHVISYQTSNDDVAAAFKTARRHLKPGGIFIFDIWYGPAVLTQRPETRIKRMADKKIEVTRLAEPILRPNKNTVEVNYHIFIRDFNTGSITELKETHHMRYFFQPEIEWLAACHNLQIIMSGEWLTGKPISENTWGACFLLQALN